MNPALFLLGPLAGPECLRALGRGWLIAVRTLSAGALALVALFVVWFWWLGVRLDASYNPSSELRGALAVGSMILLSISVVMPPAVLAGLLAGERERGVLQLLLAAAVSAREVVVGRMAGKLSQVGMVLLAGFAPLALLAAWNGLGLAQLMTLVLLLGAAAAGGGGMGVCASVLSRRGRDALTGVYLVILLLLLSPLARNLGLSVELAAPLSVLNPYLSMARLTWDGDTLPALATSGVWLGMGLLGVSVASWRLRPSCLAVGVVIQTVKRRGRVRRLADRPMLWKELNIERAGSLGRLGRLLGLLITVPLLVASLGLTGVILWSLFGRGDSEWAGWSTGQMAALLDGTGPYLGWLLQWAIGLRAAVSIASERERGTWDALLVSPLEPREIVSAKLLGSVYALRWLIGAMVLAWTLGLAVGVASAGTYAQWLIGNLLAGVLMAAIGLRSSLTLPTATKAMTWTIASWLVASAFLPLLALSLIALSMLLFAAIWTVSVRFGLAPYSTTPWFPLGWSTAWALAMDAVTLLSAVLVALETSLRFDRLAGRQGISAVAALVGADQVAHRPVLLGGSSK
jgi:ABC-type transport system involved in multi-copper enzyme maturation permease subunit